MPDRTTAFTLRKVGLVIVPGDPRHQIGVVGEFRRVLERESGRTFIGSGHDQCRDLGDLALTP
jgi:hypothetical protein